MSVHAVGIVVSRERITVHVVGSECVKEEYQRVNGELVCVGGNFEDEDLLGGRDDLVSQLCGLVAMGSPILDIMEELNKK